MKKSLLTLSILACFLLGRGQTDSLRFANTLNHQIERTILNDYYTLKPYFEEAYALFPEIPRGILEAVSYNYSRFHHLHPDSAILQDANAIPATYGVMGLTLDGKGIFRNNLVKVSQLSGFSVQSICDSPRDNILAYATAYHRLLQNAKIRSSQLQSQIPILRELSELPDSGNRQMDFAEASNLYAIFHFFENDTFRKAIGITSAPADYARCFGKMASLLQARGVTLTRKTPKKVSLNRNGESDYAQAIWNPAATCNYSSRNGHNVSAITVHYTQGTYAGAIAWFQNCSAQVSAHYVLRSSDGQVTQMVREADKAWHVGNCNPYTVGLEHEAYGNISSFFTTAMYVSSAALTRDICNRNGISPLRMFYRDTLDDGTVLNYGIHSLGGESACIKIRGHQHFPGQTHTDPGPYWNWNYYFKLVNNDTPTTTYHAQQGTFSDSGGVDGNYGNDERQLYLIEVPNAESITLNFTDFQLESNYDFMWIYDGNSVYAPCLGRWNTTSPGTIHASGNALLVEFRSDCATTAAGWRAGWTATMSAQDNAPVTEIGWDENAWASQDFSVNFTDTDDHEVSYRFYQVMGNTGIRWTANTSRGFLCDNFDDFNINLWQVRSGQWGITDHRLQQTATGDAQVTIPVNTQLSDAHLYDFYAAVINQESANGLLEVRFHCTESESFLNGYALVVNPANQQVSLIKRTVSITRTLATRTLATAQAHYYTYRILHDHTQGIIKVFRNGILILEAQDTNPITTEGKQFALYTHNETLILDNLRVYRSRNANVTINVSGDSDCDACYQANNGNARTKIKSVILDNASHFSALKEKLVKVDYTPPTMNGTVTDGNGQFDVDTWQFRNFTASWNSATDPNSPIRKYDYIVRTRTDKNMQSWIGRTINSYLTDRFPFITNTQYFVKVRAQNAAGLYSSYIQSDGFVYKPASLGNSGNIVATLTPNPASDQITLFLNQIDELQPEIGNADGNLKTISTDKDENDEDGNLKSAHETIPKVSATSLPYQLRIYDQCGKLMVQKEMAEMQSSIQISDWASGIYILQILHDGKIVDYQKIIKQ